MRVDSGSGAGSASGSSSGSGAGSGSGSSVVATVGPSFASVLSGPLPLLTLPPPSAPPLGSLIGGRPSDGPNTTASGSVKSTYSPLQKSHASTAGAGPSIVTPSSTSGLKVRLQHAASSHATRSGFRRTISGSASLHCLETPSAGGSSSTLSSHASGSRPVHKLPRSSSLTMSDWNTTIVLRAAISSTVPDAGWKAADGCEACGARVTSSKSPGESRGEVAAGASISAVTSGAESVIFAARLACSSDASLPMPVVNSDAFTERGKKIACVAASSGAALSCRCEAAGALSAAAANARSAAATAAAATAQRASVVPVALPPRAASLPAPRRRRHGMAEAPREGSALLISV